MTVELDAFFSGNAAGYEKVKGRDPNEQLSGSTYERDHHMA